MSKVSIIVPIYNKENCLRRCVDSILAQDYKDIEVILIDDGSKDDSFKIISEYEKKDDRIVAIHKENSGVSATRNLALSMAKGEYIQFIDADDWLPFDSTKLMVRSIEEDKSDLVVGDFYRVVDEKSSKKGSIRRSGVITRNEYADRMLLTPADFYFGVLWNKLYRKKIIDKYDVRMDENISFAEDAIFNLQYLMHTDMISIIKSPVYYYVKTEGSLVSQNISIQNIVKMKKTVIRYYDDFYRQILDEDEYEARRPIIYGYLIAISTDGLSLPLIDETRKVTNSETSYLLLERKDSQLQFIQLCSGIYDRLLSAVGQQSSLEDNEVRILYFLYLKGEKCPLEEISEACAISSANCMINLTKLVAMSYVRISEIRLFEENKVYYEYVNGELDRQFEKVEDDYRNLCYDGLNKEEIDAYEKAGKKILANIRKTIVSE